MIYRILFLFLLLVVACSSGNSTETEANQPAANNTTVSATIDRDLESPDFSIQVTGAQPGKAYLIAFFCETRYYADSAIVDNTGSIAFKRSEPYNPGLYYAVFPGQIGLQFIIDADQTFSLKASSADPVLTMKVEGSVDNALLYENLKYETNYQARFEPIASKLQSLTEGTPEFTATKAEQDKLIEERNTTLEELFSKHPNSFFTVFKKAGQNPEVKDFRKPDGSVDAIAQLEAYRGEFWSNVDFNDDRLIRTPVIFNKLNRYITQLTNQNPNDLIASINTLMSQAPLNSEYYRFFTNWIAVKYQPGETPVMDAEAIYVHMVQNYFTKEKASWMDSLEIYRLQLRASEMANSLVGQKGPNVKAPDPQGVERAIYDLKAPYIVIFMYNPTCDHCIEETPKLVQFYNEWKNKGVDVYAIAVDTTPEEWKSFIGSNGMTFTNVFDPTNRSIYKTYYVDNTPEIYILNKDREIIAKNLKVDQIPQVLAKDQQG